MFNLLVKININFLKQLASVFISNFENNYIYFTFYRKYINFTKKNSYSIYKTTSYSTIFYFFNLFADTIFKNVVFFYERFTVFFFKNKEYFFILEFKLIDYVGLFFILNFIIFLIYILFNKNKVFVFYKICIFFVTYLFILSPLLFSNYICFALLDFFFLVFIAYFLALWLSISLFLNYVAVFIKTTQLLSEDQSTLSLRLQEHALSYLHVTSFLPVAILLFKILVINFFLIRDILSKVSPTLNTFIQKYLEIALEFRYCVYTFYTNSENIFYSYAEYALSLKLAKIAIDTLTNILTVTSNLEIAYSDISVLNQFDEIFNFTFIVKYVVALIILALILLLLPSLLSEEVLDIEKNSAYECGFEPFFINSIGIEVHFLIVAFIFLIFDMELLFLTMKIVNSGCLGDLGLTIAAIYTLTIFLMLMVEFINGALSWPTWFSFVWQDDSVYELSMKSYKYSYRHSRTLK